MFAWFRAIGHEACVCKRGLVYLGFSMRFGFIGFWPFHVLPPFTFVPFTHTLVLFRFMSFCLHVLAPHPFSLSRTHLSDPLRTRALALENRFEVALLFTRRLGSSVVPGHLASFHCNLTHPVCLALLSCPHPFVCFARTHAH